MVKLFGVVRDEWIADDVQGWLAPNRIYPGVAAALQGAMGDQETYIVTTKQVGGQLLDGFSPAFTH